MRGETNTSCETLAGSAAMNFSKVHRLCDICTGICGRFCSIRDPALWKVDRRFKNALAWGLARCEHDSCGAPSDK